MTFVPVVSGYNNPDRIPPAYFLFLYDNPSNGGTINGHSNGYIQSASCSPGTYVQVPIASTPISGYGFNQWTTSGPSGPGQLASTVANPTTITLVCGFDYYLYANYVSFPSLTNLLTYSCNGCSPSKGSAPSSNNNNPSSLSGFSQSQACGVLVNGAFRDPYCIWVAAGSYNGNNYVHLIFNDNTSACCNRQNPPFPNGNTTIDMTIQLTGSGSALVTAMGIDFVSANGKPVDIGNVFLDNYGATLSTSVNDLAGEVAQEAQAGYIPYCGSPFNAAYCQLGEAYKDVSWGLVDLTNVLLNSALTHNFYNDQVPHVATAVVNWLSKQELSCIISYGLIAGSAAAIAISGGAAAPIVLGAFGVVGGIGVVYLDGCY